MTLLSDILKELRELLVKTPIRYEGDRPFPLADYIRNAITVYGRKAIHIVLRRYGCKSRELPILAQVLHRALYSLMNYPQLYDFWESKVQEIYEKICLG